MSPPKTLSEFLTQVAVQAGDPALLDTAYDHFERHIAAGHARTAGEQR